MRCLLIAILAFMLTLPVAAQDFEAGMAAYKRGDYAMALREWLPLAEQGNEKAQALLGGMYYMGRGVQQDDVNAAMWLDLAARQGDQSAARLRNHAISEMTPADVAEAQRLAREWMEKHGK